MPFDALKTMKPRVRAKLPSDDHIRSVFACTVNNRDGVLVLTDSAVLVVTLGGFSHHAAGFALAWLSHDVGQAYTLRLYGERIKITFESTADAERAAREIRSVGDEARGSVAARQMALREPFPMGTDDRLLSRCVFLGGGNVDVSVRSQVDLLFGASDIRVYGSPAQQGREPVATLPYARQFTVEVSGPGRFTTGEGFAGGGFGLGGAVVGMAIAGILNSLTTRTRVVSVVALLSVEYEAFFLCQEYTPEELRRVLAPVFLRVRQMNITVKMSENLSIDGEEAGQQTQGGGPARYSIPAPSGVATITTSENLVGTLERLAALHQAGALTDTEFEQAKRRALEPGA